jgi:hypothetical protein
MKNKTNYLYLAILLFLCLIYYNYQSAQKSLKDTGRSPQEITLKSYPETVKTGNSGSFSWEIKTSPDQIATDTTIFWGPISSPSGLLITDSPDAVGYPNRLNDYYSGSFKLPDTFDLNIKFSDSGKVFFRAYAKVGENHLWSEEKTIKVTSN